ncbi:hypothetical protein [Pararhodospirillum photometricum]|uniref:Protein kinase domain-containing protein n=1 Tax=Pararhodospirillum photometricum DSM 122 TaxID=1150469 RepID=H6SKI4_PARPM|nr:hypothetical protein [Pararhodospirillum photometricum]CCG08499.1 Putative uncharacterized protein [Pararhodospirillum photometricum DSM 122]
MAQEPKATNNVKSGPVVLRERFEIDPSKPLAALDMPNARAFACSDRRNPQRPVYALIVDGPLPPRVGVMRTLRGVSATGLLPLMEWGVVDWPALDGRVMAVVYERPMGGRVMRDMGEVFQPVPDQHFIKLVLKPLVAALGELRLHSVVHRAIRPTNLYWMDREQTRIALGDCATSPPGYDQPMICETIEGGMANPEGRGAGYYPADMYALGATLVTLSVGHNTRSDLTDDEILTSKISNGSYASVVGEERVPLAVIELARGLLVDDPAQRWTLDAIDLWLNGRRTMPLQTKQDKRSQRPFSFRGDEYFTCRSLAHALARDWEAGAVPIMENKVETWLRRGLEMTELADSVSNIVRASNATAKEAGPIRDLAMAAVLTLMDPVAPVRCNKIRMHMEALGTALACTLALRGDVRPYVDMIMRDFAKTWVAAQDDFQLDYTRFDGEFRDLRSYLVQTSKGGGVERCLYELNEALACRSALLLDQCVVEIKDLLPALERAAVKADRKQWPADRHITAYIAARYPRDTMAQIHSYNDPDPRKAALGGLSLLAVLQWKLGPESLPSLTEWIAGLMAPVLEGYHSRERRKRLEKEMPKVVRKGSLVELYHLLDNPEERQADFDGFAVARRQYAQAAQQVAALESGNYRVSEKSEKLGQQTAATVSVAIAALSIIIVTIISLV